MWSPFLASTAPGSGEILPWAMVTSIETVFPVPPLAELPPAPEPALLPLAQAPSRTNVRARTGSRTRVRGVVTVIATEHATMKVPARTGELRPTRGGDRLPDRLSALDTSFLYMEEPTTAMHVGNVSVFQAPPEGFDYETLVALIRERIVYAPRFRQRVRTVPGRLGNPVWVDD